MAYTDLGGRDKALWIVKNRFARFVAATVRESLSPLRANRRPSCILFDILGMRKEPTRWGTPQPEKALTQAGCV